MRSRPLFRRLVAASVFGAAVATLSLAQPAHAAVIAVDTTSDVVNGADGLTSLREAISAANAAAEPTTVELAAAMTYDLTICGPDDDTNAGGDLDHTTTQNLTINGHGATINQTCAGQRILHTIDTIAATVAINGAILTGGQGNAAAVQFGNNLVLTAVTVTGNDSGADGALNDDPAESGSSLTLVDSTVGPNVGNGVRISFGAVTIEHSTIHQNTLSGVALVDGSLAVSDSTVIDNGEDGLRTTGQGGGAFPLDRTVVRNNGRVGVVCSNCGDLTVTSSSISLNKAGGIHVAVDLDPPGLRTTNVITSSVFDNSRTGEGAGLRITVTEANEAAPVVQTVVTSSTFSGNTATGVAGRGGAIFAATGEVRVNNSTLTGNTAGVSGGGIEPALGDIFLQHATVVENEAPAGANINTTHGLHAFGSIVAAGAGGGDDCEIGGATTSTGYNVGDDGTCAFTGTGDQNSAGDPALAPLQDNGGLTLTRLPLSGSPAYNAVPTAACIVLTVDQRGVARPQGTACEAGATEINLGSGGNGGLPVTGTSISGFVVAGLALLVLGVLALVVTRTRTRRRP